MNESLLRFLIVWGPTLLFVLIVLGGFVWGLVRGFRKSLILFIHMIVAFTVCLIVFLCMAQNKNLDSSMVNFTNNIIGKFSSNSIQDILQVDSSLSTMRDILFAKIVSNMSEESLMYYLVVDNAAYIYTLVDVAYHLILFIVSLLLYLLLIFLFY
ncbi:MAG: hypothetical protein K2H02_01760, partial [Anaeroplasmataceae bacterium]|nr:hypothetical protein [Anaeroplasmataceae bacterium]